MASKVLKPLSYKNRDFTTTLQFIMPSVIIMVLLILFPIARAIIMAFQEWQLTSAAVYHPLWVL